MYTTEPTAAPTNESLYIARAQTLGTEIRKYLVHLAERTKTPIELNIHARPQCIATDIRTALLAREQHFMPREAELAAHECANSHSAVSIEMGRQGLAGFIAGIVAPLAEYTCTQEVHLEIRIGHELPSPFAAHGMAVCVTFDCKHGTVCQRFAPALETCPPASENEVTLGMTLVCRPGKMGAHQVREDSSRSDIAKLLQGDAALYQWTLLVLLILGNEKAALDAKYTQEQQIAIKQAGDALRTYILTLTPKKQAQVIEAANRMSAEMPAENALPPGSMAFVDELHRLLEPVKHVSPALGQAIEHFEEALERVVPAGAPDHANALNPVGNEEHTAAHDMLSESPPPLFHPHIVHRNAPGLAPEEK